MRLLFICLFLLSANFIPNLFAQDMSPQIRREIDSLKNELVLASQDTIKARLLYQIGAKTRNTRISYWDSVRVFAGKCGALLWEHRANVALGYFYSQLGQHEQARNYYEQNYKIALQLGDKAEIMSAIEHTSQYYYSTSNVTKTLEYCYKGIRVAEELGDSLKVAQGYSLAGTCYFATRQTSKALTMQLKCLRIYRQLKNNRGILDVLMSIGSVYVALHDTDKASAYYMECKKYPNPFTDDIHSVELYNSISAGHNMRGELDSALMYAQKSYKLALRSGYKQALSSALSVLSGLYLDKNDLQIAEKYALEGLQIAREVGFGLQIPELTLTLKKIYAKEGRYKEALDMQEMHTRIQDSLTSESNKKQTLQKEFDYSLEKKENANKLLVQQNRIQALELRHNKFFLWTLGGLVLTIVFIAYLLFRQNRFKTEHQRIQLEQKLLRAQMNPHFIFNCLNSIQQFVMSGKNDSAEWYLSRFSTLIRELLNSSLKENLSLKEEADILNAYLEMESLRFDEAFTYTITIDEKINTTDTLIPQLMVQPFVENAIWHGLLTKRGDRNLKVSFDYDTEKTIRCTIDDNGVGREASAKKVKIHKKKSLALTFAKQRMALIRETNKTTGDIIIEDKKNADGKSAGTKVVILLPVL